MPKGPRGEKRPADVIGSAITVGRLATGDLSEDDLKSAKDRKKDPNAAALGKKGGAARAAALTKKRRSEIAKKAAKTRWKRD